MTVKAAQTTLAQYLNNNAGKGFSNHVVLVNVSSGGEITMSIFPNGRQGETHTFKVVDNVCDPL